METGNKWVLLNRGVFLIVKFLKAINAMHLTFYLFGRPWTIFAPAIIRHTQYENYSMDDGPARPHIIKGYIKITGQADIKI